MPRVISDEDFNGAAPIKRNYDAPEAAAKPAPKEAMGEGFVYALSKAIIEGFREMPTPIVHVEAPKAPEVKVNSPVYVSPARIDIPQAPEVVIPEGKQPIVNVEPATVNLSVSRPKAWHFKIKRNDYGQMTDIYARVDEE
jgi:hypothetical protein